MGDRKSRFNLFGFKRRKKGLNGGDDRNNLEDDNDTLGFPSFESIIPENSPLKKNSGVDSGFYNDDLKSDAKISGDENYGDLKGVDEKYAKYIFSNEDSPLKRDDVNYLTEDSKVSSALDTSDLEEFGFFDSDRLNSEDVGFRNKGNIKSKLLGFRENLSNRDKSSKTLFGKITVILILLVLLSSIFYFFVYQPFQNELELERNSKLNEVNALYHGPLEINDNAYSLKNQINKAYDIEEIKSIDVLMFATKDWRVYHSSKIVSSKDDFGRVMMSYGENRNILMSVKDANDFVSANDAKILSNVQFEKVNTVIVPISISRLQATGGLISVGSVVDIYSLSDNSTEYDYVSSEDVQSQSNETTGEKSSLEDEGIDVELSSDEIGGNEDGESLKSKDEDPMVSGATVLAILRSKDSGIVDSSISRSNTIIKGNETNPFENTSAYSSDVEEQLKASVLNSNNDYNSLDSYLLNYGVRLSNFERMSNLGDLDSEYLVLLEVPQGDVNFIINNMGNLILTIPTDFAPNWVVSELNETYYENLYHGQSLDFF